MACIIWKQTEEGGEGGKKGGRQREGGRGGGEKKKARRRRRKNRGRETEKVHGMTKRAKTSRQRQREIGKRDGDPGLRKRQCEIEIRHKKREARGARDRRGLIARGVS